MGRWDLAKLTYEPGAWIRARVFPRRSDLSQDGKYLCCFVHDPRADWEHGDSYVTVSKLPWLGALHAFGTCGTWTRGCHFADPSDPPAPDDEQLPHGLRLRATPVVQFAGERRRGWKESPDSPPREAGGAWDAQRNARLQKRQPGGDAVLCVESVGHAGGEFGIGQAVDGMHVRYTLERGKERTDLNDLQWADWDAGGRLLVATRCGQLAVRELSGAGFRTLCEEDLSALGPDPVEAPEWATRW